MFAAYPRQEVPRATVEVYRDCLVEYDPASVLEAIEGLIRSSTFLASVAELRERVQEIDNEKARRRRQEDELREQREIAAEIEARTPEQQAKIKAQIKGTIKKLAEGMTMPTLDEGQGDERHELPA